MRTRFSLGYFIVALLLMILIQNLFLAETIHRIPYSEFKEFLRTDKIESVTLSQDEIRGLVKEGQESVLGGTRLFSTVRVQDADLVNELEQHGVKYSGRYENTWVTTLLSWVVPIVIFFGIWSLIFRRMSPGGTVMTIGRSKAKIYGENEVKVTFNEVADVQEAKDELVEIVEFLRNPKKIPAPGRENPQGGSPRRPARHRQDSAGPRRGR
jgi:cell division protease FtsH